MNNDTAGHLISPHHSPNNEVHLTVWVVGRMPDICSEVYPWVKVVGIRVCAAQTNLFLHRGNTMTAALSYIPASSRSASAATNAPNYRRNYVRRTDRRAGVAKCAHMSRNPRWLLLT